MRMATADGALLTRYEAAEYLNLSLDGLNQWRKDGYGPASFALGRKRYYRRAEVDAFISHQEQAAWADRSLTRA
jgi:excisionase family DNA binding protein